MFDNPDVLITLAILAIVGWAALRQGRANPVDTGTLQAEIAEVKQDVASVKTDVAAVKRETATIKSEAKAIRVELDGCPTGEDIAALKELLATEMAAARREIAANQLLGEKTDQAVIRIEMLLMERALPPAGGGRTRR